MGGSINLQGGGQYQTPNIQGYGQNAANVGQSAAGYGRRYGMGDYGMPQQYDGGYGDFGGQFPGVSTGGKGFQQPTYQPAPVLQPYTSSPQMSYDTSTGGKGFQTRQTPAQSVAYAPMNIPQMQLAQPGFYYPNIGSQMANLNANYGMGGLGAMGAFGNYPMMPRQPAPMQMYPALQPVAPPPPTSTGGKGMRTQPPVTQPSRPGYGSQPGYPPVGTGGKGFQPNPPYQPPYQPPTQPTYPNEPDIQYPSEPNIPYFDEPNIRYPSEPEIPNYGMRDDNNILRPVRPEDYGNAYVPPQYNTSVPEPLPEEVLQRLGNVPTAIGGETDTSKYFDALKTTPGGGPIYVADPRELTAYQENRWDDQDRAVEAQRGITAQQDFQDYAQQYMTPNASPPSDVQQAGVESTMPTYEEETVYPFMGLDQRNLID